MKWSASNIQGIHDSKLAADLDVHHLNQRLHYLIQVIQHLATARDLSSIMAAVRTGARQLTGADGATFVLREGDKCYYADEDAISPLWKGGRFPMSACISGWVMLNQQSVMIEDIYADPRIPADAYRPTFVQSLAMVPIRTRDPMGAIGNYWATHHHPTADEMNLLQTLADAAAVALENLQLYEEQEHRIQERTAQLQQALDFEALLRRITDKVRDSLDEHQILTTVIRELAEGLSLNCCNTSLYSLEQAAATVCYKCTRSQFKAECERITAMAEFPELYRQLLEGNTFQFCHLPQSLILPPVEVGTVTLACPIMDDQRVWGDIRLYRTSGELFTDFEVRLVEHVANQCAIALRQARLHEAAQQQVEELERLNRLKDDFLSTVSHELRSPMTTIRMAVQMLETVLGVVNQTPPSSVTTDMIISRSNFSKAVGYLHILNKECHRETALINDLLDLTRVEAEITPGNVEKTLLQDWIPEFVEPFRERSQQHQQQFQINIPASLPPLKTNLTILERILTELLQNACKYTPANETITLSVQLDSAENTVSNSLSFPFLLTVCNSGVEISEGDRTHIFEKFYRIPNSDPWKHGGTGLGLALVKRLVERLSGSIDVTSSDNQVCFMVRLASIE